jgi:hypothetical protein
MIVVLMLLAIAGAGSMLPVGASAVPFTASAHVPEGGGTDAVRDPVQAEAALKQLSDRYEYLDDVTITFGATPSGYEAVSYYTEGRIVINPAHTVDVETILNHEIWHIIDWRADGRLDWDEYVPPASADDYLKR